MASFSSSFFLGLLVVISAFMAAPSSVEAQVPLLNRVIKINGTVPCAVDTILSPGGTLPDGVPPFSNAVLELRCGNTTLVNRRADGEGNFDISESLGNLADDAMRGLLQNQIQNLFTVLLNSGCKIVVKTPLAQCNADLPSVGELESKVILSTELGVEYRINPAIFQSFQLGNIFN